MAGNSTVEDVPPPQYQVFINFRGEELRNGFVSHLVHALEKKNINAFYDRYAVRGEYLENLLKKIEESRIGVVILSINYNESAWSLRELAKMKECMDGGKLVTIPIFYKVSTSTVVDMSKKLDKAIKSLKGGDETTKKKALKWITSLICVRVKKDSNENKKFQKNVEGVYKKEWEEALTWITSLTGFRVKKDSNENKKVHKIVEAVYKRLIEIQLEGSQEASLDPSENIETEISLDGDFLDRIFTKDSMAGRVEPPNIQLFINFRGEQLRDNFVSYLVYALQERGINVFIDNHEQRGEDLNPLKRIEDSGIAIVVFSSRYTESKWCLDELVKIQERVHQGMLKVLPIFYKVTPGNVKRLKGEFGDHFRDKEYMYRSDEPKIKRWKEAIAFVSHQLGMIFPAMTLDEKSSESDFVAAIVKEVLKMLSTVESGQSSH